MNRRTFVAASAALPAAFAQTGSSKLPIRKAVLFSMLPKDMPLLERFQLAREVGFEEMECHTEADEGQAEAIKKAADTAKLRIHSVMNSDHWRYPLSSSDADVVGRSMKGMHTSLRNAKLWGADTVLLVPAVVDAKTSYGDAWKRSQQEIRKLIPMAEDLKVVIAGGVRNVASSAVSCSSAESQLPWQAPPACSYCSAGRSTSPRSKASCQALPR
jgi:hexulose-6-phosphate isomerase